MKTKISIVGLTVLLSIMIAGIWLTLPKIKPTPKYSETLYGLSPEFPLLLSGMPKENIPAVVSRRTGLDFHRVSEYGYDENKPYKKDLLFITVEDFDKNGNLTNIYYGKEKRDWIAYKYAEKGYRLSGRLYGNFYEAKWFYKYDNIGRVIEESFYDIRGQEEELIGKAVYQYNGDEKKIDQIWWYPKEGNLHSKIFYQYDDKGNMVEWSWVALSGEFILRQTYKYDDAGRLSEEYGQTSNSPQQDQTSFNTVTIYEYNKEGLVTAKITWGMTWDPEKKRTVKILCSKLIYEYDFYEWR